MDRRFFKKKTIIKGAVLLSALGISGFLILTSPWTWSVTHPTRDIADSSDIDLKNGRNIFVASDCATCHASPNQGDAFRLGGGRELDTEFGKFYMPNISPDKKDGIGSWTLAQFTKAMREGVGPSKILPDGENLYPAFPYTSYQRLTANDVRDMFAYIQTLAPVSGRAPDHALKFPYNIRRGIGVWRLAFLDGKPIEADIAVEKGEAVESQDRLPLLERGRYLVEGAGHCVECHSPRNFMGVIKTGMRYGGGLTPDGVGYFPNISQHETGIDFWAEASIFNYLKTGVSPLGKVSGGDMAEVIENTSKLPDGDLKAMAAYLKTLPGVDQLAPGQPELNYSDKIVQLPAKRSEVSMPVSPPADIAQADTLYVVQTKPFYLDSKAMSEDKQGSNGKLLGGTRVSVLERQGSQLRVMVKGWQVDGVTSVIYAANGKRIMSAVADESVVAQLERGQPVKSEDTGVLWTPVTANLWVDDKGLSASGESLWAFNANLLNSNCATCHSKPDERHYTANQWIGVMGMMRRYTALNEEQYRLLLAYTQNHAKDMGAEKATHP